jgi:hypothetical protein
MVKEYWSKKLGIPTDDIDVRETGGGNYEVRTMTEEGWSEWSEESVDTLKSNLSTQRAGEITTAEAAEMDKNIKAQAKAFNDKFGEMAKGFSTFIGDGVGDFSALTTEEFAKVSNQWKGKSWSDVKGNKELMAELKA